MPGTTAFAGPGFQWLVDIGTTGNFIPIAYSQDIEGPTISRNMADISNQTSQLGKEVKPALIDNGTITTTIIYNPGDPNVKAALAALNQGVGANVKILNNPPVNTMYWSGFGYFSEFKPKAPYNGTQTASVVFTISGGVTQN